MGQTVMVNRRKQAGRRPLRVIIKLTPEEHSLLQSRSATAGLYMAAYIRQMTFDGKLVPRLTAEEKDIFRQLVVLSNELHRLGETARREGLLEVAHSLGEWNKRMDMIMEKFRS